MDNPGRGNGSIFASRSDAEEADRQDIDVTALPADPQDALILDPAQQDAASDVLARGPADSPAIGLAAPDELDRYVRRDLRKEEMAIARQYQGGRMWPYVVIAWGGFALWLSLFPLTMMGIMPLWIAFVISCVLATGGYVTSHEAMHSNIARPGTRHRWVNEWVGKVSTIPIVFPFSMARLMHLEHHYHCNHPEKDPDYTDEAPNSLMAWYKTWYNRQPGVDGSIHHYKRILAEMGTPEAAKALKDTLKLQLLFMAVLFTMAWNGYAIEAALVWWLPRHIGLSYIRFYLSWAPHHPREGNTGRYEQAVIFKSRLGHVMSMGMETHLIHHLYPNIPNHRTRAAYFALKPILEQRGVDISKM
ncbi:beta-carotene hydroxylase [Altererythrobacter xixiisoli]|uniref:Beta-carotene hydroxylase n=1 Tax=Croceibacterium xixiisoli TaxID=1476466 RepID=A0A6I4TRN0_9SPHN|nr:fatty acid desaturase [Croceibacterium xixiisoli]MXO98524.1 beta-carotene hydroxylase [Croceibacterium xixiisoli]